MDTKPYIPPVSLDDIEQAAERISDRVRRTPCLRTRYILNPPCPGQVMLKLECLQVTGSFKARGANNAALSLDAAAAKRGIITASSGNHGAAVAYAGYASDVPAVIYLPERAPKRLADKLRHWGAELVIEGDVWDDANQAALARAEKDGLTYIHPFADTDVIAGQGTVGREMMKQSKDIDTVIVAIGGGGLISGVATAVKAKKPDVRIIGVEPTGAPTLKESVAAGDTITLPAIETGALSLAPRKSDALNLGIIESFVDEIVLVSDDEMRDAARWLWFEMGIAAELAGAAAVAALQTGRVSVNEESIAAAIVCGSGDAGLG